MGRKKLCGARSALGWKCDLPPHEGDDHASDGDGFHASSKGPDLAKIVRKAHASKLSKREQRKYDGFCAGVTRARRGLLEVSDRLEAAMQAISQRKIPCKIANLVGRRAWKKFADLDTDVLELLERAQDLEAVLEPSRRLDAAGQAPCPGCGQIKTTLGVLCADCEP